MHGPANLRIRGDRIVRGYVMSKTRIEKILSAAAPAALNVKTFTVPGKVTSSETWPPTAPERVSVMRS